MNQSDIPGLRRDLERRAELSITFHDWDPYILGATDELAPQVLSAGELARREAARWRRGRFPSIPLCIADAVFSKQREYLSVVRSAIRPFADAFKNTPLTEFVEVPWVDVFQSTFGKEPRTTDSPKHSHLSPEGRIRSVIGGSKVFARLGVLDPAQARAALSQPGPYADLRHRVLRVNGIGEALFDETCMNLGHLTIKSDVHVRRVLAPFLGPGIDDAASRFVSALETLEAELGMSPFVIDQLIWYTESASGGAR